MSDPATTPTGVDLKDTESTFIVSWEDGTQTRIPYRLLRLACCCALCIEEMTGKQLLDPETVPKDIGVADCEQVGLYGISFKWTDGHTTGIYGWDRLRELGSQ